MKALWLVLGCLVMSALAVGQAVDKPFQYRGSVYGLANLGF